MPMIILTRPDMREYYTQPPSATYPSSLIVVADGRDEDRVVAEAGEGVGQVPPHAAQPEGDAARVSAAVGVNPRLGHRSDDVEDGSANHNWPRPP